MQPCYERVKDWLNENLVALWIFALCTALTQVHNKNNTAATFKTTNTAATFKTRVKQQLHSNQEGSTAEVMGDLMSITWIICL